MLALPQQWEGAQYLTVSQSISSLALDICVHVTHTPVGKLIEPASATWKNSPQYLETCYLREGNPRVLRMSETLSSPTTVLTALGFGILLTVSVFCTMHVFWCTLSS